MNATDFSIGLTQNAPNQWFDGADSTDLYGEQQTPGEYD